MPKIVAYVMLSDPEWLVPSVSSYYDICDEIIATYDENFMGHSGHKIDVAECLERLTCLVDHSKVKIVKGRFAKFKDPHDNESYQRSTGVTLASDRGADWILHIDTDEIVPDVSWLYEQLSGNIPQDRKSIEIAAKVFYGHDNKQLLQISSFKNKIGYFENLAIAVRPRTQLRRARFTGNQLIYRPNPKKKELAKQFAKKLLGKNYYQLRRIEPVRCLLHMSWLRSEVGMRNKVQSWAHLNDFNVEAYLVQYWNKANKGKWKDLKYLHPIWPDMWECLTPELVENLKLDKNLESLFKNEISYIMSR